MCSARLGKAIVLSECELIFEIKGLSPRVSIVGPGGWWNRTILNSRFGWHFHERAQWDELVQRPALRDEVIGMINLLAGMLRSLSIEEVEALTVSSRGQNLTREEHSGEDIAIFLFELADSLIPE